VTPVPRQIPLVLALLFGGVFSAAGLLVYALLLGHIPTQAGAMQAPPAIVWLVGTVFFSAGLGMMSFRLMPKFAGFCALIALCAFVATFNWIAFGPGERNFTKSTSLSGSGISSSKKQAASETEGRLVFGIFAGAMDALILFGLYKALRHRSGDQRYPSPGGKAPATHRKA
jgi:hypothetical protein